MNYLVTIVGPTAIGKTSLSIKLAEYFNTEIISCDSRQFFKEMSIGTAVPDDEVLSLIPHHFMQNKSIHQNYTVGDFEKEALAKLEELFKKYRIAIMVGGSGLYADALIYGLDSFPDIHPNIRKKLNDQLKEKGLSFLQKQLKIVDPVSYEKISIDNPHRVIRALEVYLSSGEIYSSFKKEKKSLRDFTSIKIGLSAERKMIYKKIEEKVDLMIQKGLVEEAKKLHPFKELNALKTLGYKELFRFFEKKISLELAIDEIKKNSRRFAKKQLTWFHKDKNIRWFDVSTPEKKIIQTIKKYLN